MSNFLFCDHHIHTDDRRDINVTLRRNRDGEVIGAILHIDKPMSEDELAELIGKGADSWTHFFSE